MQEFDPETADLASGPEGLHPRSPVWPPSAWAEADRHRRAWCRSSGAAGRRFALAALQHAAFASAEAQPGFERPGSIPVKVRPGETLETPCCARGIAPNDAHQAVTALAGRDRHRQHQGRHGLRAPPSPSAPRSRAARPG